jgi:hypothetical protein
MRCALIMSVLIAGCAAQDQSRSKLATLQREAKTLCELMEDPGRYAGRRVMIKAIYVRAPHHPALDDPDCPQSDFSISHSLTADNDPAAQRTLQRAMRKSPTVGVPVVYVGTFKVEPFITTCTERSCYHYSLENAQLLAASPR